MTDVNCQTSVTRAGFTVRKRIVPVTNVAGTLAIKSQTAIRPPAMHAPTTRTWDDAWPAALLVFPSLAVVAKYGGTPGLITYPLVVMGALALRRHAASRVPALTERHATALTIGTFAVLLTTFAVVYPLANAQLPGRGSDRDDALNLATRALLRFEYPYGSPTYLGNPITPLPGSLLFASPFVLLGNSAFQNFAWLAVFARTVQQALHARAAGLALVWVTLVLSPVVANELLTGGDLLANTLFVLILLMWSVRHLARHDLALGHRAAIAAGFGVALSSRVLFLLLAPLAFRALAERGGPRQASAFAAIAVASFSLVTLPFYLFDPSHFSPLHVAERLSGFRKALPHSELAIAGASVVVAGLFAWLSPGADERRLLRNAALIMAFPVLCAVVLHSVASHTPQLRLSAYGLPAMVAGVTSWWLGRCQPVSSAYIHPNTNTPT